MTPYFIFNNIDSREYNILVNSLPPIQTIDEEVAYIEVPGRDGYLTVPQGRRPSLEKELILTIHPSNYLGQIKRWLSGSGRLILSNDRDVYYNAKIQALREIQLAHREEGFNISFKCQPWGYLHSGDNKIVIDTKNTNLSNPEQLSKPLIKIFGSGQVDLMINSDIHKFVIDEYVEIDSELMESYKGNKLATFKGKFPVLAPGENNITWDGVVDKIEVIPRWRR